MTVPSLIWMLERSLMLSVSMEAWILPFYPSFRKRWRLKVWKVRRRFCRRWARFWTALTLKRCHRLTCFQTQRFFRLQTTQLVYLVAYLVSQVLNICKNNWLICFCQTFPLTAQESSAFRSSVSASVPQNLTITSFKVRKSKFPLLYPVIDRIHAQFPSPQRHWWNCWRETTGIYLCKSNGCNFCSVQFYLKDNRYWIFTDSES